MWNSIRTRLVGFAALAVLPVAPLMLNVETASATAFSSCGVISGDATIGSSLNSQLHDKMAGAMDAESTACARVIAQTVRAHGLDKRAAQIAVTTAIIESSLHNLTEAVDHDSLGLFQQRASWGSVAQRTDPAYATNAFLNAMLRSYPNNSWETTPIGEVCQTVQVSAYPERYQPQAADAGIIVDAVWNGATPIAYGPSTPGLARSADGHLTFYLTNDRGGDGVTDYIVHYGNTGDVAVTGDWNGDGHASPGLVRNEAGHLTWYLTNDLSGNGVTDYIVHYGNAGDIPVIGDWNGDRKASPGLVRNESGHLTWYLTNDIGGTGVTDYIVHYGNAGDIPVAGDWNIDHRSSPGLVRNENEHLTWYLTNDMSSTGVTDFIVHYGNAGDIPVAGDWNADGRSSIGLVRETNNTYTWYLTNDMTGTGVTDFIIHYGYHGDQPVTNNWN
jgi:hypothetical protein